jgi:hypothetical protein
MPFIKEAIEASFRLDLRDDFSIKNGIFMPDPRATVYIQLPGGYRFLILISVFFSVRPVDLGWPGEFPGYLYDVEVGRKRPGTIKFYLTKRLSNSVPEINFASLDGETKPLRMVLNRFPLTSIHIHK